MKQEKGEDGEDDATEKNEGMQSWRKRSKIRYSKFGGRWRGMTDVKTGRYGEHRGDTYVDSKSWLFNR